MWTRLVNVLSLVVFLAVSCGAYGELPEELASKEPEAVGLCVSNDGLVQNPCARYKDGEDYYLLVFGTHRGIMVPAIVILQAKGSWASKDQKTVWRNPIFFPEA